MKYLNLSINLCYFKLKHKFGTILLKVYPNKNYLSI